MRQERRTGNDPGNRKTEAGQVRSKGHVVRIKRGWDSGHEEWYRSLRSGRRTGEDPAEAKGER